MTAAPRPSRKEARHGNVAATGPSGGLAGKDARPRHAGRTGGPEKARLLASLEEEGETYLEGLPEPLQDQAGHRLHRFSASARNALRIGSIFYMSALLYPEDHKPGQPDDLQVFIRRLRDEGEHYTLHPQD